MGLWWLCVSKWASTNPGPGKSWQAETGFGVTPMGLNNDGSERPKRLSHPLFPVKLHYLFIFPLSDLMSIQDPRSIIIIIA